MNIPAKDDEVWIESSRYTGDATVVYVDTTTLYHDHLYPIQVQIPESNLDQLDDYNHGQTMQRFSLKEVIVTNPPHKGIISNEQGSLFDDL